MGAGALFSIHEKQLYEVSKFLLKTGTIFFQPRKLLLNDSNELQFESFFCLSSPWLGNILHSLILSNSQFNSDGIVLKSELEKVWSSLPSFLYTPLIELFCSIDILNPIPSNFISYNSMTTTEVLHSLEELAKKREAVAKQPRLLRRGSGSKNIF